MSDDEACRTCRGTGITGGTVVESWYCSCCDGGGFKRSAAERRRIEAQRQIEGWTAVIRGTDPAKAG